MNTKMFLEGSSQPLPLALWCFVTIDRVTLFLCTKKYKCQGIPKTRYRLHSVTIWHLAAETIRSQDSFRVGCVKIT